MAKVTQIYRNAIIGVRFSPEERGSVEEAAKLLGVTTSEYIRRVALAAAPAPKAPAPVQSTIMDVQPVEEHAVPVEVRTWRAEFEQMKVMLPPDAKQHMATLINGRAYPPPEFASLDGRQRVEWLDRYWPLGMKA